MGIFDWQKCFTRKGFVRKSCYDKKIQILSVKKRIEKANQYSISEKQYQNLDNTFEFDRIKKEKPTI